jgi:hypothetical protein
MKTYLLTTLVAALLLVPALAGAATTSQPAGQPQSNTLIANSAAPPSPQVTFAPQPAPSFWGNVAVSATIPGGNPALRDSTAVLMNQTGGGR